MIQHSEISEWVLVNHSEGKTVKVSVELTKDGKPQRKELQIQVYGMKNGYELNCYIG